jgi:hypothetical protein
MSIHAYGASIRLRGIATANNSDGTSAPYVGACTIFILPPDAAAINSHPITTTATGAWEYLVHKTETGYAPGTWRYCVRNTSSSDGATFDKEFEVRASFAPLA